MKDFPLICSGPMVRANHAGIKRMTRRVVDLERLKLVMRKDMRPDYPLNLLPDKCDTLAPAGMKLSGIIHAGGAVSCRTPSGDVLGLKPEEFDFVCPYAQGETILATAGGKQTWTIIPHESRVWVRECFRLSIACGFYVYRADPGRAQTTRILRETHKEPWMKWTPSIHMPRLACRDVYTVTKVRIERLQNITDEDAIAEGIEFRADCLEEGWRNYLSKDPLLPTYCLSPKASFNSLWQLLNGKKPGCTWDDNPWVWVVEYDNPLWKERAA